MSNSKYLLNILGSVAIFAIIFYFFDIGKALEIIKNADYRYVLAAFVAYFIVNIAMSLRISVVLKKLGFKLYFKDIIKSNFAGMIASDFTPARVGYFFTAFSLSSKLKEPSIDKTILSILGPQLLDFMIKISSAAILTLFMIYAIGVTDLNGILVAASIAIMFSVIIFFGLLITYPPLLEKFSFVKKISVGRKFFSLIKLMQKNSDSLFQIKWSIIGITLVSWIFKGIEWFLLAKSVGIVLMQDDLQMIVFLMIFQGATTVLQFIPIPTIAGSGTSEAAFTGLLVLLGIKPEVGLAFALLTRFTMIVVDSIGVPVVLEYIRKNGIKGLMNQLEELEAKQY